MRIKLLGAFLWVYFAFIALSSPVWGAEGYAIDNMK